MLPQQLTSMTSTIDLANSRACDVCHVNYPINERGCPICTSGKGSSSDTSSKSDSEFEALPALAPPAPRDDLLCDICDLQFPALDVSCPVCTCVCDGNRYKAWPLCSNVTHAGHPIEHRSVATAFQANLSVLRQAFLPVLSAYLNEQKAKNQV